MVNKASLRVLIAHGSSLWQKGVMLGHKGSIRDVSERETKPEGQKWNKNRKSGFHYSSTDLMFLKLLISPALPVELLSELEF